MCNTSWAASAVSLSIQACLSLCSARLSPCLGLLFGLCNRSCSSSAIHLTSGTRLSVHRKSSAAKSVKDQTAACISGSCTVPAVMFATCMSVTQTAFCCSEDAMTFPLLMLTCYRPGSDSDAIVGPCHIVSHLARPPSSSTVGSHLLYNTCCLWHAPAAPCQHWEPGQPACACRQHL